jgi:arylsulfatase A-like enzyme
MVAVDDARLKGACAAILLCAATLLAACGRAEPPPPAGTPRLAVLIVVDQLGQEQLERAAPLLTGGLARLRATGASFTDAHHAHAGTSTGPGHATLATGAHPARHGVVANDWYDRGRGEWVYCAEDPERGLMSPVQLRVPALGDRLKQRWPRSRVFAASGKDRSAVLLGGRRADGAFWFDDGEFVTGDYYFPRGAPEWLEEFNERQWPRRLLGRAWEPLPVAPEAAAAAGVVEADYGAFGGGLPRALGGFSPAADGGFRYAFAHSPFLDEHLGELARALIAAERLGADAYPDLLALSFSALDLVGHQWGPNSPEALDVVLRVDRTLGELLALLDREVGEGAVVVALSSDHGVAPLPELAAALGVPGRRAGREDVLCLQRADLELERRFGAGVDWLDGDFYLDAAELAERDLDPDEVAADAAALVERCPAVARAWTHAELRAESSGRDGGAYREAFRRSFDPERSPDLLIEVEPYHLPLTNFQTTHGSPHPYDTHVPLIFAGPGVPAAAIAGRVATVDLAPTLAALLGLPPPEGIDGSSLLPRLAAETAAAGAAGTRAGVALTAAEPAVPAP